MTVAYVDASAIVKLIVPEAESEALVSSLRGYDDHVTSVIAHVEVPRAVRRTGLDPDLVMTIDVLSRFATVALDHTVVEVARRLEPSRLRSLDAIHIASAISLGIEDLAFVAYDQLCLEGAAHSGLAPSSPG
ncbi:MAG TPA: type II toxin-antitoxin system VapC family toxin [Acidimicrobiia bacterium]|nr:type II toxin-antitoxin system VapC family toxin [Acidimicrobiia bacterium]